MLRGLYQMLIWYVDDADTRSGTGNTEFFFVCEFCKALKDWAPTLFLDQENLKSVYLPKPAAPWVSRDLYLE